MLFCAEALTLPFPEERVHGHLERKTPGMELYFMTSLDSIFWARSWLDTS